MGLPAKISIHCQKVPYTKVLIALLAIWFCYSILLLHNCSKTEIQNQFELKAFNTKHFDERSGGKLEFDYKSAMAALNAAQTRADDPLLVALIRRYYIEEPSELKYNLVNPQTRDPSEGQATYVDKEFKQKENGFFIECGGLDGEYLSNSLFLERYRNWSGILIEANPTSYKNLKARHRKAFTLNACLSTKPYPSMVRYGRERIIGDDAINPDLLDFDGGPYTDVQCFPLYSILLALNQLKVDYFSLDVEGAEEPILNAIPWDKVDINMMSIEYNKFNGGETALKTYMQKRHYKYLTSIHKKFAADIIVQKL